MRILYGLTAVTLFLLTLFLARVFDENSVLDPSLEGPHFADIGDGTIVDNRSGLVWLKDVGCLGPQTWQDALSLCRSLTSGDCGLRDDSTPGRWRLPRLEELRALLDPGNFSPVLPHKHPFAGLADGCYWAASDPSSTSGNPRHIYIGDGGAGLGGQNICELRHRADPDARFFFLAVLSPTPNFPVPTQK